MNIFKIAKGMFKYAFNTDYRFDFNASRGRYDNMPDEEYLKRLYKAKNGKELNLDNPKTFNEKLNWLKMHDRNPLYTDMVDKYKAKVFISKLIGDEYIIPTIAAWDNPEEIVFQALPEKFVLKTNHGCGGMYICRGERIDEDRVRSKLKKALDRNYFYQAREWPYKNVKPMVFAEEYVQNGQTEVLQVYKIFNFNGVPKIIQMVSNDKTKDETIDYFDTEWNLLNLTQNYPNSAYIPPKPITLDKMLHLSSVCSQNIPFVRTDWYEVNGSVFFSEITFYSDAGMETFHPETWNSILGDWIHLPQIEEHQE